MFNTPNDQSRPGYLKMGWQVVGRVPIGVRPARSAVLRCAWSGPGYRPTSGRSTSTAGMPAEEALDDDHSLDRLLAATGRRHRAAPA